MHTREHLLTVKHQSVMLNVLSQTINNGRNTRNDEQLETSQMNFDLPQTTMSNSNSSNDTLNETINVLFGSIESLNNDIQQHSSQNIRTQYALHSLSGDFGKIKKSIQEINNSSEGTETNHHILRQDFTSLQQYVEDQQGISYDGTLIWRITDVQKKIGMLFKQKQIYEIKLYFYSYLFVIFS